MESESCIQICLVVAIKIKNNTTPAFIVNVKAKDHQIKQPVKKAMSLVWPMSRPSRMKPDREKKAYVQLASMMHQILPIKLGSSKLNPVG